MTSAVNNYPLLFFSMMVLTLVHYWITTPTPPPKIHRLTNATFSAGRLAHFSGPCFEFCKDFQTIILPNLCKILSFPSLLEMLPTQALLKSSLPMNKIQIAKGRRGKVTRFIKKCFMSFMSFMSFMIDILYYLGTHLLHNPCLQ